MNKNEYMVNYRKTHPEYYFQANEKAKLWARNHRELVKNRQTERNRATKYKVLESYSTNGKIQCFCCGESIFELLGIDHINNDGHIHRKTIGQTYSIYRWLIKNNFPEGYQISCLNCNWGRSRFGICPHQKEKQERTYVRTYAYYLLLLTYYYTTTLANYSKRYCVD